MSTYDLVLLLLIALVLATLLVLFLPARRSRTPAGPPAERDLADPGPWSREDDRFWLGGLIYYNPGDPEPFIPKRFGLGWTVNFGWRCSILGSPGRAATRLAVIPRPEHITRMPALTHAHATRA
jgi:uncharacterized membrane protein